MQDDMIVDLYWQRNESAVRETQNKYGAMLMKIAMNILCDRSDSEESVNDTYLAAWNSIPPQKPALLSAYLSKLNRRISIDLFRKRSSQKRAASEYALSLTELDDVISGGEMPEEELDAALLAKAISTFLRTLSRDEQTAFIGRYFYLDSVKDVSAYCGMKEARVKSMLYRTRCKLRTYLTEEGFDL